MINFPASPLHPLAHPLLTEKQITLSVKREDLVHPQLQGNKWRKLKYNIAYFLEHKKQYGATILTFGGAHSNHIYATAAAGKLLGIATIGVIRGERIEPLNATLAFAEQNGMYLHFITRADYRLRATAALSNILHQKFGAFYEIPEGGSNGLAVQGVAEWADELPECDYVALAAGTGATAAGLLLGAKQHTVAYKTLAFSVLKGGDFLKNDIFDFAKKAALADDTSVFKKENIFFENKNTLFAKNIEGNTENDFDAYFDTNFHLFTEYHGGGYAKNSLGLQNFITNFIEITNIRIEHVYTAKLFYGLFDLIEKDYFLPQTNIIAIHTGGLR